MQGLPIHQLQKSAQGSVKTGSVDSAKASHAAKGENAQVENGEGDFASLFAGLAGKVSQGKEGKASQVESQTGETLKNLLAEKKAETKSENSESPKAQQVNVEQLMSKNAEGKTEVKPEGLVLKTDGKVEQQIAKTNSSLDQLLNNLKGTQDYVPVDESEGETEMPSLRHRNGDPAKAESKNESPLDFLVKGTKAKGVTENTEGKVESAPVQKKVVTGEDFIKNMQAADKKPALAVLNGQKGEELPAAKMMMNQNAKAYGQGMTMMNDSLIRNTKDFANKDVKKGKQNLMGIDELHTKDTKAGAELATLRQEAVPALQNNKENHGQSQLNANANQKVLDLSHINTTNTSEIIKKISDYVEQNNVANKQSLDLTVKHESLGEFKIQVTKVPESMNGGLNQIDMQITTSSKEGHDFFVKNEVSLMKNLNQSGINLSDLRIVASSSESSAFGQSDSRQSSSFSQNQDGSRQFSSFESSSFSSGNGAERRKALWEEAQQRYGA